MQFNRISYDANKPVLPTKNNTTHIQNFLKFNSPVDSFHFSGRPFITEETKRLLDLAYEQKDKSSEEKRLILSRLTNEAVYQLPGGNPSAQRENLIYKYEVARDLVTESYLPQASHSSVIDWLQTCINAIAEPDSVPYVPTRLEYEPQPVFGKIKCTRVAK